MKKIIFTICCTVFFAFSMSAQSITLTINNMDPQNVAGVNTLAPVVMDANALSTSFAPHINATWDLTNLYYGPTYTHTFLSGPSPFNYSDTVFYNIHKLDFHYLRLCYTVLQGYIEQGIEVDTQSYHINNDTTQPLIGFTTEQINPLPVAYHILPLPLTYKDTWATNDQYKIAFNVIDTAYSLLSPGVTGYIIETISENDSVVGYGKMRVNRTDTTSGELTKSGYYNTLQVNRTYIQIDSAYLNDTGGVYTRILDSLQFPTYYTYTTDGSGNITDSTSHILHSVFDTVYQQLFYRVGELTPLATATFADAGHNTLTGITVNTNGLSMFNEGIGSIANTDNVSIYPNPVVNNQLFVDITNTSEGAWSYELVNMAGQTVSGNAIASGTNSIHAQVALPRELAAGVYYLRINKDGAQYSVKALDIIK
jgi:hypothetical protein